MAMHDEIGTITLGGVAHQVEALSLDRLQVAVPLVVKYYENLQNGAPITSDEMIALAGDIISMAMDLPKSQIKACVDELQDAVAEIASVTGMVRLGERMKAAMEAAASP